MSGHVLQQMVMSMFEIDKEIYEEITSDLNISGKVCHIILYSDMNMHCVNPTCCKNVSNMLIHANQSLSCMVLYKISVIRLWLCTSWFLDFCLFKLTLRWTWYKNAETSSTMYGNNMNVSKIWSTKVNKNLMNLTKVFSC